ncbi:MAG: DUF4422 domain-containing protein [Opitutales bacterium]
MATGLQVYVVTHRPFPEVGAGYARTLWVGEAGEGRGDSDRIGDSIWEKNPTHCELTALYWIWKNALSTQRDHVGLFHYRRYLALNQKMMDNTCLLGKSAVLVPVSDVCSRGMLASSEVDLALLRETDVVLPRPMPLDLSIREHFIKAHGEQGWEVMDYAVRKVWPGWANDLCRFEETACRLGNVLVARGSVFASFCEWLFPIINAMEQIVAKLPSFDANRFFGYPAERLTHLYFDRLAEEGLVVREAPTLILDDANEDVWRFLREAGVGDIWIWGAGALGRRLLRGARLLGAAETIDAFVDGDSAKKGKKVESLPVHLPAELEARKKSADAPFVIIASTAWREIESELTAMGFAEGAEYAVLRGLT